MRNNILQLLDQGNTLTGALISPFWLKRIFTNILNLPQGIKYSAFGFESNILTKKKKADFALCLSPILRDRLGSNNLEQPTLISKLCKLWMLEDIFDCISNIWLEYDSYIFKRSSPKIFFSLNIKYRITKTDEVFKEKVFSPIKKIVHCFTGRSISSLQENIVNECIFISNIKKEIHQIGFTILKKRTAIRLCIKFFTIGSIKKYLSIVKPYNNYTPLLDTLKKVIEVKDYILHITITHKIENKISIEMRLSGDDLVFEKQNLWREVLSKLEKNSLCSTEKKKALFDWPCRKFDINNTGATASINNYMLYYLKLGFSPGKKIIPKAYYGIITNTVSNYRVKEEKVSRAISKGLLYLCKKQQPSGEWLSRKSSNPYLIKSEPDKEVFSTALILGALIDIKNISCKKMQEKGIAFIKSQAQINNLWSFWTRENKKQLPPDVDDTAYCSFILKKYDSHLQLNNEKYLLQNRNSVGLFNTWIKEKDEPNDVDIIVNTNVCAYLGETENTKRIISHIISKIKKNEEELFYWYYTNNYALYYMVSNAFKNSIKSFKEVKDLIIRRILKTQNIYGAFTDSFYTSLSIITLYNFDYHNLNTIVPSINYILNTQTPDGSWEKEAFYNGPEPPRPQSVWFGSRELTTAFCLHALTLFQKYYAREKIKK